MKKSLAVLCLFILFATGCATVDEGPINHIAGHRDSVHGTRVVVQIAQKNMDYEVKPSNVAMVAGGGVIPSLIDTAVEHHRYSESSRLARPLEDILSNYSFDRKMTDAVEQHLKALDWLHVVTVSNEKVDKWDDLLDILGEGENTLLLVDVHYILGRALNKLVIRADVRLYLKGDDAEDTSLDDPLLRRRIVFIRYATSENRRDSIKAWMADKGGFFIKALDDGIAYDAKMIVEALGKAPVDEDEERDTADLVVGGS